MIMNFDVKKTVSFDIDDDLSERLLTFVECNMWENHPDSDDYINLSEEDQRALIIAILKTALKKYKNT